MPDKYLVTFTPIDGFFLGSSRSFSENFYVESLKYPHPTTILGCLRNTILIQNGIIKKRNGRTIPNLDKGSGAKELTGTSFLANGIRDKDNNFGIIKKISPIFIVEQRNEKLDALFPVPKDVIENDSGISVFRHERKNDALSSYSGKRKPYAIRTDKGNKEYCAEYIGGEIFWRDYCSGNSLQYNKKYKTSSIFIEHSTFGIGRKNRMAEDGKFYNKIEYKLKKGFSFGVIVCMSEEYKLKDDTVILGGEQSTFNMNVTKLPLQPVNTFETHPIIKSIINEESDFKEIMSSVAKEEKIVAISSLIYEGNIEEKMQHAIISGIDTTRSLIKQTDIKTDSFCMIPASSVLYPSGNINNIKEWNIPSKIGYNSVIKVNKAEK